MIFLARFAFYLHFSTGFIKHVRRCTTASGEEFDDISTDINKYNEDIPASGEEFDGGTPTCSHYLYTSGDKGMSIYGRTIRCPNWEQGIQENNRTT